jgi:predicted Zn-ribbon and HTH transcriptional regulator
MSQKPDDQMTFDEVWAELHKARAALKGPDGFESWQDAAVNERVRRARAVDALRHAKKFIEELRVPQNPEQAGAQVLRGSWALEKINNVLSTEDEPKVVDLKCASCGYTDRVYTGSLSARSCPSCHTRRA